MMQCTGPNIVMEPLLQTYPTKGQLRAKLEVGFCNSLTINYSVPSLYRIILHLKLLIYTSFEVMPSVSFIYFNTVTSSKNPYYSSPCSIADRLLAPPPKALDSTTVLPSPALALTPQLAGR